MQFRPDAKLVPLMQAPPAGHAAAHLRCKVFSRHACLEHEQDSSQRRTVWHWRTATFGTQPGRRQQQRDVRPEIISDERPGYAAPIGMDKFWLYFLLGALNYTQPSSKTFHRVYILREAA